MKKVNGEREEKTAGKFTLFFLWGVIPLLFAAAVFFIVAQVLGWDVLEKAEDFREEIPFLAAEEETADQSESEAAADTDLEALLAAKESELTALQTEMEELSHQNEELLIEQSRLEDEIAVLTRDNEAERTEFSEVVKTFESMSAKAAAPVLAEMTDEEALRILKGMKPDATAAILEKMEPATAATLAGMMTE